MPALTIPPLTAEWPQPRAPRFERWPATVRSALRLSGAIVACGPGFRGLGWPETPRTRLAAISEHLASRRVASHLTAAWVWGARYQPPDPLHIAMPAGMRRPVVQTGTVRFFEIRYHADEVITLGDLSVTTPLRTISDLLFLPEFEPSDRAACRLLSRLVAGGADAVSAHIFSLHRPHVSRARERVTQTW